MNARKILAFYVMSLTALLMYYQHSQTLSSAFSDADQHRAPASASLRNSENSPICSEWVQHGLHQTRRCERTFEPTGWGHFEIFGAKEEDFPQTGLFIGRRRLNKDEAQFEAVVEYWIPRADLSEITRHTLLSLNLQLIPEKAASCKGSDATHAQVIKSDRSLASLKWSELKQSDKMLPFDFSQKDWTLQTHSFDHVQRRLFQDLVSKNKGRLLLHLKPELDQRCTTEFNRAPLHVRYLEVL